MIAVVWLYGDGLTGNARIAAHHDNLDLTNPSRVEAARQWREGRLPLWNPYKRLGMPLLADPTAGALYPGNLPYLLGDNSPRYRALEQVAAIHGILAALSMFFFLRTLRLDHTAAALGALVYAANGFTLWTAANFIHMQSSLAWAPAILACVHRSSTEARWRPWAAAGGLCVALQVLAGYPEYSLYTGLIAGGYALALASRRGSAPSRPLLAVTVIYAAGAALAAVQLIPAIELQLVSRRPGSLELSTFQAVPASPMMPLDWVTPGRREQLFSVPPAATYVGMLAIPFAVEGLRRRGYLRWFLVVLLLLGSLLAVGSATPVSAVLHEVPGFSAFRHAFKHLLEVSVALSVLTAVGADRYINRSRGALPVVTIATAVCLLIAVVRATTGAAGEPEIEQIRQRGAQFAVLLAFGGGLSFAMYRYWQRPRAAVLIAFVALCPSYWVNHGALVELSWKGVDRYLEQPEAARLMTAEARVLAIRLAFQKREPEYLLGDFPTEFRVMAIHGAGPFLWKPLADATTMVEEEVLRDPSILDGRVPLLDLIGCRYLVATKARDGRFRHSHYLREPYYRTLLDGSDYVVVERTAAHPLVHFADRASCETDEDTAAMIRGSLPLDVRDTAPVSCAGRPALPARFAPAAVARVKEIERSPGRWEFSTNVAASLPAFLVVSHADMPGWRATIDGKPAALYRSYGLIQGIVVPGGEHRVVLEYEAPGLFAGAAVSAASLLLVCVLLVMGARRRFTHPPAALS